MIEILGVMEMRELKSDNISIGCKIPISDNVCGIIFESLKSGGEMNAKGRVKHGTKKGL